MKNLAIVFFSCFLSIVIFLIIIKLTLNKFNIQPNIHKKNRDVWCTPQHMGDSHAILAMCATAPNIQRHHFIVLFEALSHRFACGATRVNESCLICH